MNDKDIIYRQAALDAMETWDKFGCDPDGKLVRYDDDKHYIPYVHYEDMVHVIKHLPSAQPEIITCIDCIHYTPLGKDKAWGRCSVHSSPTENQRMCQSCDFCVWAERRTDE